MFRYMCRAALQRPGLWSLGLIVALSGCAAFGDRDAYVRPRFVALVRVDECDQCELAKKLANSIVETLKANNVFTRIYRGDDSPPADRTSPRAEAAEKREPHEKLQLKEDRLPEDMTLTLNVEGTPGLLRIGRDPQACILGFLAWSFLPPVCLFIPGVEYTLGPRSEEDSEMPVRTNATLTITWGVEEVWSRRSYECESYGTTLLDRTGFLEHPEYYFGSLLLPPWIFSGADKEALQRELQERFIADAARSFTEEIKHRVKPEALEADKCELDPAKRIIVNLEGCRAEAAGYSICLGIRIPAEGQNLTRLDVLVKNKLIPSCRTVGHDELVDFSRGCREEAQTRTFTFSGSLKEGDIIRVKVVGYAQDAVSYTFALGREDFLGPEDAASNLIVQPAAESPVENSAPASLVQQPRASER